MNACVPGATVIGMLGVGAGLTVVEHVFSNLASRPT